MRSKEHDQQFASEFGSFWTFCENCEG